MNNRYKFLLDNDEYEITNLVRNALLAAGDGEDVNEIMNAILTTDEKIKIGRRIQIASMIFSGMNGQEIKEILKVGRNTITLVSKHLDKYQKGFELILDRQKKVEKEFGKKAYKKVGGSKLVHKKKEYTGLTRKDIKRL
jgi:Trp operon repressor